MKKILMYIGKSQFIYRCSFFFFKPENAVFCSQNSPVCQENEWDARKLSDTVSPNKQNYQMNNFPLTELQDKPHC